MRRVVRILFFTVLFVSAEKGLAQEGLDTPTHLIRVYEDDDFINIWGQGSDNAYTNGTRLDYFYNPDHPSRFFIDRLFPKAGAGSVNTYGWGIAQVMYTPDKLLVEDYQPNDYPYSGALYATHTLYSYNPATKFSFQNELVLGVIGPASLAGPTQRLVHQWEGFDIPRGWSHQYRNDVLVNLNLTAEKQLAHAGRGLEVIGGSQLSAGTMQNSLTVYPLIRFGNLTPYFNGFISQFATTGKNRDGGRKGQFYFFVKPAAQLVLTNALLQGGVFTHNPNLHPLPDSKPAPVTGQGPQTTNLETIPPQPYPDLNKLETSLTYGAVFSSGNFGLYFSQITSSAQLKGLYCHQTGNISLYFSW